MYAINPTSRFTLITPDECTKKLPNSSLDSTKWQSAIELAEARFIEPVLGWTFYDSFCTQKNVVVDSFNIAALQSIFTAEFGTDPFSGNPRVILQLGMIVNAIDLVTVSAANALLWNKALWNFVYNCVWFVALNENYAQFTSSGIQKNNPLDSAIGSTSSANVGISLADLKYLTDKWLLERINPLQEYLQKYICVNIAQYPLFPQDTCRRYNNVDHMSIRTTPFIDIYADDRDRYNHDGWCNSAPIPPTPPAPSFRATCSISLSIATVPDTSTVLLCNLSSILAQYPVSATTLILPNLAGKYVNSAGASFRGQPIEIVPLTSLDYLGGLAIGYDFVTGTFYRDRMGGWNDGDTFSFLYIETS